jgi:hypothetical protein
MRIYASPMLSFGNKRPLSLDGTGMPRRERLRMCEVPEHAHFFHTAVSLMPISCDQIFFNVSAAKLLRSDGSAAENSKRR